MTIDKLLAKYTDIGISGVTGKLFLLGSTAEVVVKIGTIVHADLENVLSLAMFVSWGMRVVWPATPYPTQLFCRKCGRYNNHTSIHILTLNPDRTPISGADIGTHKWTRTRDGIDTYINKRIYPFSRFSRIVHLQTDIIKKYWQGSTSTN